MQVAKSVRNKIQSKYLISFLSACLALNIYIRLTRLCCLFFFCPSFIHNFNFQLAVFLFCYSGLSILFHLLICILLFFPVCSAAYQCQTQGQCQRECCQALDGTNSIMRSSLSVPCVITLFNFILFIVFLLNLFSPTHNACCTGNLPPLGNELWTCCFSREWIYSSFCTAEISAIVLR